MSDAPSINSQPLSADEILAMLDRVDRRRSQRRDIEWKVSLALWAGLLASAKVLLDGADKLDASLTDSDWLGALKVLAVAALIIVVVGHWAYVVAVTMAHAKDRAAACELEGQLGQGEDNESTGLLNLVAGIFQGAMTLIAAGVLATIAFAVVFP